MNAFRFALLFSAMLVQSLTGYANDLSAQPGMLRAFGFNQLNIPSQIPAVAMLMTYRDRPNFSPAHTPEYFRELLFGNSTSVRDYFLANSNGRFRMNPADIPASARTRAVLGPFRNTDYRATDVNEEDFGCAFGDLTSCPGSEGGNVLTRRRAVALAAANGFDFGVFDTNRNGIVETTELLFVLIHAGPGGGAVRGPDCTTVLSATRGWIQVCIKVAMVQEGGNIGLFSHEISHLLGTVDLYGCWDCAPKLNEGVTNLSMDRPFLHFDPLHKIELGWVTPKIFDLAEGDNCSLLAAQSASPDLAEDKRPVILYDSRRPAGAREFFVMEYRTPRPLLRGDPHDRALEGGEGLAIWQVRRGNNGALSSIPYLIVPRGSGPITSLLQGDDRVLSRDSHGNPTNIFFGANSILDSILNSSQDKTITANFNLLVPANGDSLGSPTDSSNRFWGAGDETFSLAWMSSSPGLAPVQRMVPTWFRASSPRANDPLIGVRWSTRPEFLVSETMARGDAQSLRCWSRTDPLSVPSDRLEPNDNAETATLLRPFPTDSRPGLTFHSTRPGSTRSSDNDVFRFTLDQPTGLAIRLRHDTLLPIRVQLSREIGAEGSGYYPSAVPLINNYGTENVYTWYTLPAGRYKALLTSPSAQVYDLEVESGDQLYHPPAVASVRVSPQCFESPDLSKKSKSKAIEANGDTTTITTQLRVQIPAAQSIALITLSTDSPTARITSANYFVIDNSLPAEMDVTIETPLRTQFNLIVAIPTSESILITYRFPMGVNGISGSQGKVISCDEFMRAQSEFAKLAAALESVAVESFTTRNTQPTPIPGFFPVPHVGYLPKLFPESPISSRWPSEIDRIPGDRPPPTSFTPVVGANDSTKLILDSFSKLGILPVDHLPKK